MLKAGKLPVELLRTLITMTGAPDPRVVIGPRFGEDCAVIDLGDRYLVTKTDPITFTWEQIGWYAVHVNANDVAVMGAKPLWFQACLLFPLETREEHVREVFSQIDGACGDLQISVTGGHTELTAAVRQTVVVGDMHGLVEKDRLVTSSGARPGDVVAMTKTAGIEGTSILARTQGQDVKGRIPQPLLADAGALRESVSVVPEALLAAEHGATAMHDPTEGGVAMGLYEMSEASGKLFEVHLDRIPVLPATDAFCRLFGLDPLGLIASGSLLLTIGEDAWPALERTLRSSGIAAAAIGRVRKGRGVQAFSGGKRVPFRFSEADELTKVL